MRPELTNPPRMVTPAKVEAAVRKIAEVCRPSRIILFGSYVRGATDRNSDLDVLVVEDAVENPRKGSVRLRRALRDIDMPIDVLVVPRSQWEALKDKPGLSYREAERTGRVVYESR